MYIVSPPVKWHPSSSPVRELKMFITVYSNSSKTYVKEKIFHTVTGKPHLNISSPNSSFVWLHVTYFDWLNHRFYQKTEGTLMSILFRFVSNTNVRQNCQQMRDSECNYAQNKSKSVSTYYILQNVKRYRNIGCNFNTAWEVT